VTETRAQTPSQTDSLTSLSHSDLSVSPSGGDLNSGRFRAGRIVGVTGDAMIIVAIVITDACLLLRARKSQERGENVTLKRE
jgi:hypothetical protein